MEANEAHNLLISQTISNSRIPDTIKLLPTYDGNKKELVTWLNTIESTLNLYRELENTPTLRIWFNYIRTKIIGKANDILTTSHTALNWIDIKAALISYFGDKRDLSTLTQKISYLKQGPKTIHDFYNESLCLLADINSNISLDPENEGHETSIMRIIERMIKDAFIDGLNEPISSYTRNCKPNNLREAYQFSSEQFSAHDRKKERNNFSFKNSSAGFLPKIPHKAQPSFTPRFPFIPNRQTSYPNQFAKHPMANYSQKPTPMEVDPSNRVKQSGIFKPNPFNQRPFNANNNFRRPFQNAFQNRAPFPVRNPVIVEELTATDNNNDPNYALDYSNYSSDYDYSEYYSDYDSDCYYYDSEHFQDPDQNPAYENENNFSTNQTNSQEHPETQETPTASQQPLIDDLNFQTASKINPIT